ncbi:hypothetical protein [Yersinia pseudotuberculosis]|uniref:hypothetical protein n=1 Tax=Yersinia pseudotuberculosis TaxID=633 RepID=UPI0005DE5153|nr:hypothetical protein [Yersinia pseudotuberculosis]CNC75503.1 Uncharacterised protein [Yersinia pseudotuberculosis]
MPELPQSICAFCLAPLKLADWLKRMALAIEAHYSEPEEEAGNDSQNPKAPEL